MYYCCSAEESFSSISAPSSCRGGVVPKWRFRLSDWPSPPLAQRRRLQLWSRVARLAASHVRCIPGHTTRAARLRQGRAWLRMPGLAPVG